jgi:ParB/RepB/Spo0J family partition protein
MSTIDSEMEVTNLPIEEVWADADFNCRGVINPIDVHELAQDIDRNGLIQPVTVAPLTDAQKAASLIKTGRTRQYRLIAGYRRYACFKVLTRGSIPCIIREDMQNEKKARLFNLSENLHRKDLDILQEVSALRPLREEQGLSEYEAATELGRSRGWVQIRYMMMSLPESINNEIAAYKLTNKQVRNLYSIYGTAGMDSTITALKTMKDGKSRGRTVFINANYKDVNKPRVRTRSDILNLLDHLGGCGIPIGIHNRCLAWAAGEISDGELYRSLINHADIEGEIYHLPGSMSEEDVPEED